MENCVVSSPKNGSILSRVPSLRLKNSDKSQTRSTLYYNCYSCTYSMVTEKYTVSMIPGWSPRTDNNRKYWKMHYQIYRGRGFLADRVWGLSEKDAMRLWKTRIKLFQDGAKTAIKGDHEYTGFRGYIKRITF